jgi:putative nucleotidyltransferase with HDIG domain
VLAATANETGAKVRGTLVAGIESDLGLTVAVLRNAQDRARRGVMSVSDAVSLLDNGEIASSIRALPRAAFPWQTPSEALLHNARVHAQTVARAAERIARELEREDRDELLTLALLHDVGKLVIARSRAGRDVLASARTSAPEERVREERSVLGVDHANLGGVLLKRWGLPERLARNVAAHHRADAAGEPATIVRLADMVAYHALGIDVDRRTMLRLATNCRLPVDALRRVLFDLPHAGGSHRRRAEPSPLTQKETTVLRHLAQGKVYKQIASDLHISHSTIRSHLHNIYRKLHVTNRAQAVLHATEMAWI